MIIMNNGKELIYEGAKHIVDSRFADIYKFEEITIKKYYDSVSPNLRITKDVFNEVSQVDKNALLKLRECFTEVIKPYKGMDYEEECVTGYTYDYIEAYNQKMIEMPMEYTLNTIHEFDILIKELNKRGILLEDPNKGNSIITKDNLVIIDPDLFEINQSEEALRENYEIANRYIMQKWAMEYPLIEEYERQEMMIQIFGDYDNDFNDDYYGSMKRRLKTKKPSDLLYTIFGEKV